jgi:flagellar hook-basal body complex protein FliE
MNEIDVNSVLAQIRAIGAQTASRPASAPAGVQNASGSFQDFLSRSVDRVNGAQGEAEQLRRAFELGDPNADLTRVMLAGAKAQVAFKGMVEVRNRLVAAYQEIMSMPV